MERIYKILDVFFVKSFILHFFAFLCIIILCNKEDMKKSNFVCVV